MKTSAQFPAQTGSSIISGSPSDVHTDGTLMLGNKNQNGFPSQKRFCAIDHYPSGECHAQL